MSDIRRFHIESDIRRFRIEQLYQDDHGGGRIVFTSIEDLEQAHKEINDGRDIYVVLGDEVIKLLNQEISPKIYDGRIRLAAKLKPLE